MKSIDEKYLMLTRILSETGSAIIACSGGTDSMYLLNEASKIKSLKLMAVTIRTPYMHPEEISETESFCQKKHLYHQVIDMEIPDTIKNNPAERCYLCKKELLLAISNIALSESYSIVFDGTNYDDLSDYRPGMKALKEYGVRSPLMEAGLTKKEIRKLSKKEGLETWDKPANACLLTRFPHNTPLSVTELHKAWEAESFLSSIGLRGSRVRVHGDLVRIELRDGQIDSVLSASTRESIIKKLKSLGYNYITADLEGYITGRMNCKSE